MNYFSGITDKKALKKRFRELALEHHPDHGGDVVVMQEINGQFKEAMRGSPSILGGIAQAFRGMGMDFSAEWLRADLEALQRQQQAQYEAMSQQYQEQGYQRAMNYFNALSQHGVDYSQCSKNEAKYANIWREPK